MTRDERDESRAWLNRMIRSIPRRLDDIGPEGPPEHSADSGAHYQTEAAPEAHPGNDDSQQGGNQ